MVLQRLLGVGGAARMEPARRRQQGTDEIPVCANQRPQHRLRCHAHCLNPEKISRKRISIAAPGLAPKGGRTNTSIAPRAACSSRNASRIQRLIPLRTFALAACLREMRMPSRAGPSARIAKSKVYPDRLLRDPSRSKRSKSAFLASRFSAPSPKRDKRDKPGKLDLCDLFARLALHSAAGMGLHGETLASLCASRAQHRAAVGGATAHQKTMRSRTSRLGWLVGSLLLHWPARSKKGRY